MERRTVKKKRGLILLAVIVILPFIMTYHIYHNKRQLEDLKNGITEIEGTYIPASSVHPESAYFWIFPYAIVEVTLTALYLVYRDH